MGLDVYFRRDIANVLRATACASEGTAGLAIELVGELGLSVSGPSAEDSLRIYRQAVRHTLISVGLAFGLEPIAPGAQARPDASTALAGLLWAEGPSET